MLNVINFWGVFKDLWRIWFRLFIFQDSFWILLSSRPSSKTQKYTNTYKKAHPSCWASSRWPSHFVHRALCCPSWRTSCLRGCSKVAWQLSLYCDLGPLLTIPRSPEAAPVECLQTEEIKLVTTSKGIKNSRGKINLTVFIHCKKKHSHKIMRTCKSI